MTVYGAKTFFVYPVDGFTQWLRAEAAYRQSRFARLAENACSPGLRDGFSLATS